MSANVTIRECTLFVVALQEVCLVNPCKLCVITLSFIITGVLLTVRGILCLMHRLANEW